MPPKVLSWADVDTDLLIEDMIPSEEVREDFYNTRGQPGATTPDDYMRDLKDFPRLRESYRKIIAKMKPKLKLAKYSDPEVQRFIRQFIKDCERRKYALNDDWKREQAKYRRDFRKDDSDSDSDSSDSSSSSSSSSSSDSSDSD
jgi:hypothetical protein